jgi:tripartite-type tricarboxylate transporter receptor subunit TctC
MTAPFVPAKAGTQRYGPWPLVSRLRGNEPRIVLEEALMAFSSISAWRRSERQRVVASVLTLAALLTALPAAQAQDYPSRAVKIIVPFPAGGTADVMPRIFSDWLAKKWGEPVVIENRSGAAGNIGAEAVAKADPDGYTLLSAPPPPLVINQNLYPRLGFDPTEFVPIVIMGRVPNALVLNARVPLASVAEVIAYAKANPGKLTCATQGNGTTSHLTAELFQLKAGVKFQQVPYRGSAPALTDLAAGNVDLMFDNLGASLALVKGGQLKLLGVASPKRMAALADVPTIAETLPGFESVTWFAIVAPPKTPEAVIDKINADVNEALHQGEIRGRLAQLSAEPMGGTPQATAAYMRQEIERWGDVIKAANVKLE